MPYTAPTPSTVAPGDTFPSTAYNIIAGDIADHETRIKAVEDTLITTVTATSGSIVNVNNCFSSTYEDYLLVGRSKTSSGVGQTFRTRVSGTDNTAGYLYAVSGQNTNNAAFTTAGSFASSWWMPDTHSGDTQFFTMTISKPQLAQITSFVARGVGYDLGAGYRYAVQYGGIISDATQYTGFSIISAGTFTDFVMRVYGIRK